MKLSLVPLGLVGILLSISTICTAMQWSTSQKSVDHFRIEKTRVPTIELAQGDNFGPAAAPTPIGGGSDALPGSANMPTPSLNNPSPNNPADNPGLQSTDKQVVNRYEGPPTLMVCGNPIVFKDTDCRNLVEHAVYLKSTLPTSDPNCAALMQQALNIEQNCPSN